MAWPYIWGKYRFGYPSRDLRPSAIVCRSGLTHNTSNVKEILRRIHGFCFPEGGEEHHVIWYASAFCPLTRTRPDLLLFLPTSFTTTLALKREHQVILKITTLRSSKFPSKIPKAAIRRARERTSSRSNPTNGRQIVKAEPTITPDSKRFETKKKTLMTHRHGGQRI